MNLAEILELFVIGLVTGVLSGLFGVGGGFILVPLLTLANVSTKTAIALSFLYIIGTAASGLIRHIQQNTLDLLLAGVVATSSVLTASFGAQLTAGMNNHLIQILFGLLTASTAIFYFLFNRQEAGVVKPGVALAEGLRVGNTEPLIVARTKLIASEKYQYRINVVLATLIGGVVGLLSGMFGVGGGFILVPLMTTILNIPLKIAVGTSLLCVIPSATAGSFTLWQAGKLELDKLPALLVGGLLGAQVGARLVMVARASQLKLAFIGLLGLVSLYMLSKGFGILS